MTRDALRDARMVAAHAEAQVAERARELRRAEPGPHVLAAIAAERFFLREPPDGALTDAVENAVGVNGSQVDGACTPAVADGAVTTIAA